MLAPPGVAFTGYVDVATALSNWAGCGSCPALAGTPLLSLGGGTAPGTFSVAALSALVADGGGLDLVVGAGYGGVVFDVEALEATDSGAALVSAFNAAFAACHAKGLKVVVTTSHSGPYSAGSAQVSVDLVASWCAEGANVDEVSPQLYSSGTEASPDFDETYFCGSAGCTWEQ